ncbi:single-stranded DNA-binding protein [Actinomyces sp. zg-332]|uniref:single-stranded DNA-binding protein n=1 Tax=Actinomyces sp. zg-332 TaxID=2708340 RepID=UPI0014206CFD|nr:single-stranded DNA-binding protein [Actinomyces sp. zg-332]QPK94118.1 single-stranded DNA-binding protein [Actinomyces sp. zg-332]
MAGETTVTIVGNLTADPELRFTPSGAAVASFIVASSTRTFDRARGEYRDGDTLFMRCSVWNGAAENVTDSLSKGMRVIVRGRLTQRSYETREGERRTAFEIRVEEVGPSLRYATAEVKRSSRGGGDYSSPDNGYAANGSVPAEATPMQNEDPWPSSVGVSSFGEEPPF